MTCLFGVIGGLVALCGQPPVKADRLVVPVRVLGAGQEDAAPEGRRKEAGPRPSESRWDPGLTDPLQPGQEVRLQSDATGPRWLRGKLLEVDGESLLLRPIGEARALRIRRAGVERLEVRIGTKRNTRAGIAIGAGLGALVLMGVGGSPEGDETGSALNMLTTGAIVGALIKTTRWRPVQAVRPRVSVAPLPRGGAAALLTLSF